MELNKEKIMKSEQAVLPNPCLEEEEEGIKHCVCSSVVGWDVVNWMHVAKDGDQWRGWAVVNMVMKPHVPQNAGNFLTKSSDC
jgi:hypothetical protein